MASGSKTNLIDVLVRINSNMNGSFCKEMSVSVCVSLWPINLFYQNVCVCPCVSACPTCPMESLLHLFYRGEAYSTWVAQKE